MDDAADIAATLDALETPKLRMAKEIGISRSYLYDVVSGKRQPTVRVANRFLCFLNRPENLRRLKRRKPVTFEEVFGTACGVTLPKAS